MSGTHTASHASLDPSHELKSLTLCRVDEAHLRPPSPVEVAYDTDVLSVVRLFQANKSTSVLVSDERTQPHRLGIFTTTGLQRAILDGQAQGSLSSFPVIAVQAADQLGDAMAEMLRHRVHRVVVRDGDAVIGIWNLWIYSAFCPTSHT